MGGEKGYTFDDGKRTAQKKVYLRYSLPTSLRHDVIPLTRNHPNPFLLSRSLCPSSFIPSVIVRC